VNMEVVPRPPQAAGPGPARILVVDDATVVRLYYRHLLEAEGYAVEEAANGVEGLEKALAGRFDLCVVDVNMPLMDGYRFLEKLRAAPATRRLPALVTTTQSAETDRAAALVAGADGFLVKPVPGDLLAVHVAALLGRAAR